MSCLSARAPSLRKQPTGLRKQGLGGKHAPLAAAGLAPVDLVEQVAPAAQKVLVGKLPAVRVHLAEALSNVARQAARQVAFLESWVLGRGRPRRLAKAQQRRNIPWPPLSLARHVACHCSCARELLPLQHPRHGATGKKAREQVPPEVLTYVFSWRTKDEKLLCLKCMGSRSRANSAGFQTMKLQVQGGGKQREAGRCHRDGRAAMTCSAEALYRQCGVGHSVCAARCVSTPTSGRPRPRKRLGRNQVRPPAHICVSGGSESNVSSLQVLIHAEPGPTPRGSRFGEEGRWGVAALLRFGGRWGVGATPAGVHEAVGPLSREWRAIGVRAGGRGTCNKAERGGRNAQREALYQPSAAQLSAPLLRLLPMSTSQGNHSVTSRPHNIPDHVSDRC